MNPYWNTRDTKDNIVWHPDALSSILCLVLSCTSNKQTRGWPFDSNFIQLWATIASTRDSQIIQHQNFGDKTFYTGMYGWLFIHLDCVPSSRHRNWSLYYYLLFILFTIKRLQKETCMLYIIMFVKHTRVCVCVKCLKKIIKSRTSWFFL